MSGEGSVVKKPRGGMVVRGVVELEFWSVEVAKVCAWTFPGTSQ